MRNVLIALALFSSVPALAANAYKFTGSTLPANVQAKIVTSANKALKGASVTGPSIAITRGTTVKAVLTGTEKSGSTSTALKLDATFAVSSTKKGSLSVTGTTAPVWIAPK